jgi:hypothetical protein
MKEYMDFRRSRKLLADNGSQEGRIRELVDPSGSTRRPTLRQVEEMLKRARNESVITENGTEHRRREIFVTIIATIFNFKPLSKS